MATDQEIRDAGFKYISQQKYLQNPFKIPVAPVGAPEGNQPFRPISNSFNNSGGDPDFNLRGNAFGYGEAVQRPGNTYADIVQRTGPDSQQAKQALVKAGGTYPAGLQSNEGGFEYTSDFGNELDYSKGAFDSLESEEEKKGFLSKMMNSFKQKTADLPSWAKAGITAAGMLNPLTAIPKLLGGMSSGEGGGPSYGIAGLSNEQKAMYDSLSGAGFLYNGPNGMKTYDGKNFSKVDQSTVDKYFAGIKDRHGSISKFKDKLKNDPMFKGQIKTFEQYELLDGTLDTFDKNETIRNEQIQKIKNAEISRKMRSGDPKNDPFSELYSGKTTSPNYTPTGPNQPDRKTKTKTKTKSTYQSGTTKRPGSGGGGGGSSSGGGGSTGSSDSTGQSTGSSGGYNDGNYCFDPSTPIQMSDGSTKKIKNIQLGDATKGGEVTGVFQFKASDEIHDYKGVTVAGSHYVKEDGKFIMVKDSPLSVKVDKIPVVYSLDTSGRRIFINDIEFADYNGDGVAKNFLSNAGVDLTGFDTEVLRQVEQRLI